jgi:hypothetical protein
LKEVVYDIEEFKAKVDTTKPVHHCAMRKSVDKYGVFYRIIFRIYGIEKNSSHILIFEAQEPIAMPELKQQWKVYEKLREKYAKPLGSTEGAWTS